MLSITAKERFGQLVGRIVNGILLEADYIEWPVTPLLHSNRLQLKPVVSELVVTERPAHFSSVAQKQEVTRRYLLPLLNYTLASETTQSYLQRSDTLCLYLSGDDTNLAFYQQVIAERVWAKIVVLCIKRTETVERLLSLHSQASWRERSVNEIIGLILVARYIANAGDSLVPALLLFRERRPERYWVETPYLPFHLEFPRECKILNYE